MFAPIRYRISAEATVTMCGVPANHRDEAGDGRRPAPGVRRIDPGSPYDRESVSGYHVGMNPYRAMPSVDRVLAHPELVDSGGYTTQLILYGAYPGTSSVGLIQFFTQSGGVFSLRYVP